MEWKALWLPPPVGLRLGSLTLFTAVGLHSPLPLGKWQRNHTLLLGLLRMQTTILQARSMLMPNKGAVMKAKEDDSFVHPTKLHVPVPCVLCQAMCVQRIESNPCLTELAF